MVIQINNTFLHSESQWLYICITQFFIVYLLIRVDLSMYPSWGPFDSGWIRIKAIDTTHDDRAELIQSVIQECITHSRCGQLLTLEYVLKEVWSEKDTQSTLLSRSLVSRSNDFSSQEFQGFPEPPWNSMFGESLSLETRY